MQASTHPNIAVSRDSDRSPPSRESAGGAAVHDEQHTNLGIVVLVDNRKRCAGNRIAVERATRIAKTVLRILGEVSIDDVVDDLPFLADHTEAELRQALGEQCLQAVDGGSRSAHAPHGVALVANRCMNAVISAL